MADTGFMRNWAFISCLACCAVMADGADWRNSGGDAQLTRWQHEESELTPTTVRSLKLRWKYDLAGPASAPLLLGPIVTHRGIKELVIVSDGRSVQAIDADLGKVFWSRHIGEGWGTAACPEHTPAPAIARGRALSPDEEAAPPTQAIFAVSTDGLLHTLRPSDGQDVRGALPFLPAGVRSSDLVASEDSIFAAWRACDNDVSGVMAVAMRGATPQAKPIQPVDPGIAKSPVISIGRDGKVRTAVPGNFARWEQPAGTHWILQPLPNGKLAAFRGPDRSRAWEAQLPRPVSAPVVAADMVFVTAGGKLRVLDAESGSILFTAAETVEGEVAGLAVANGHVCFTVGRRVFCYGLPMEI